MITLTPQLYVINFLPRLIVLIKKCIEILHIFYVFSSKYNMYSVFLVLKSTLYVVQAVN